MKLDSYHFTEEDGWDFSNIHLHRTNLFVGASGVGKSRVLNTICNLGEFISKGGEKGLRAGNWHLQFSDGNVRFEWSMKSTDNGPTKRLVEAEQLVRIVEDNRQIVFERAGAQFRYANAKLPMMSPSTPGLFLFREEEAVSPVHNWFTRILRRAFWGADLAANLAYEALPPHFEPEIKKRKGQDAFELLWEMTGQYGLGISARMYLIKRTMPQLFYEIGKIYKSVFSTIEDVDVGDAVELKIAMPQTGLMPILFLKEKHVDKKIHLQDLSSGMQKVLLILLDILTLPANGMYLIDEYENSLGVNAIGFLPEILSDLTRPAQFIITSHHPYLINKIPVKDWQLFHRKGSRVQIKAGAEFAEKYNLSRQTAFTKLINDPFYIEGVE